MTTGTPISLLIENADQRSKDYSEIKDQYRPGHADYTYDAKYGLRDYRGGGRSSARETAARVAAGAIARKVLPEVKIAARWCRWARAIDRDKWDWDEIARNPFFCPDPDTAAFFEQLSRRHPQVRLLGRRRDRGRRRRRAGRPRRADLRQARRRPRRR